MLGESMPTSNSLFGEDAVTFHFNIKIQESLQEAVKSNMETFIEGKDGKISLWKKKAFLVSIGETFSTS